MRERLLISVNATARSLASLRCHGNTPSTPLNAAGRREREMKEWELYSIQQRKITAVKERGWRRERENGQGTDAAQMRNLSHTHIIVCISWGAWGSSLLCSLDTSLPNFRLHSIIYLPGRKRCSSISSHWWYSSTPHNKKKERKKPKPLSHL